MTEPFALVGDLDFLDQSSRSAEAILGRAAYLEWGDFYQGKD